MGVEPEGAFLLAEVQGRGARAVGGCEERDALGDRQFDLLLDDRPSARVGAKGGRASRRESEVERELAVPRFRLVNPGTDRVWLRLTGDHGESENGQKQDGWPTHTRV